MKTHYDLLSVDRGASADEIKRAFRREIARYHPDKVQHLGAEFQEIAAERAAELTEAYRVLMDEQARGKYDASLTQPSGRVAPAPADRPPPAPPPQPATTPPGRRPETAGAVNPLVRKAALQRLEDAAAGAMPDAVPATLRGFDAAFTLKGRRPLFGKPAPDLQLLIRFVPEVTPEAVAESWGLARAAMGGEPACLLLLGAGVAGAPALAAAVADQRRRTRSTNLVVVPVDVRDWGALFPPETPAPVRDMVARLRNERR